jgi:hypothetical protein
MLRTSNHVPRAWTADEVRGKVLAHIVSMSHYWAELKNPSIGDTIQDRLDGLAFSLLAMLDGSSIELPRFSIIPFPHPADKQYNQEHGENWYPDPPDLSNACDIGGSLHEAFNTAVRKLRK